MHAACELELEFIYILFILHRILHFQGQFHVDLFIYLFQTPSTKTCFLPSVYLMSIENDCSH